MTDIEKKYVILMIRYALEVPSSKIPRGIWNKIKIILELLSREGYLIPRYEYQGIKHRGKYRIEGIYIDEYLKNPIYYEKLLNGNEDFQKYIKYIEKYENRPKYKLGENTHSYYIQGKEIIVHQIVAEKDFTAKNEFFEYQLVKKGTTAGWIESEKNLSQEGFCWNEKGIICGNALVREDAFVYNCTVCGNALIQGNSLCSASTISDDVVISDDARIYNSNIKNNVEIFGNSVIFTCNLWENIWIEDSELSYKNLKGNYKMKRKD